MLRVLFDSDDNIDGGSMPAIDGIRCDFDAIQSRAQTVFQSHDIKGELAFFSKIRKLF